MDTDKVCPPSSCGPISHARNDIGPIGGQDVEHSVDRVLIPELGDLRNRFALQWDQLGVLHRADGRVGSPFRRTDPTNDLAHQ